MPRGDKSKYTDRQKRKAQHIEEGYEKRGVAEKEAERRAWATVNKEEGGGNKSGSDAAYRTRKSHRARAGGSADARAPRGRLRRDHARRKRPRRRASAARPSGGFFSQNNPMQRHNFHTHHRYPPQ